jgi:hypothetical protein
MDFYVFLDKFEAFPQKIFSDGMTKKHIIINFIITMLFSCFAVVGLVLFNSFLMNVLQRCLFMAVIFCIYIACVNLLIKAFR